MNKIKSTKGITLISLVVTIIILIILAGVSITLVLGDNGIITRAKEARRETEEKSVMEKVSLMLAEYATEKYTETKTLEEYLNEQKTKGELDEGPNNDGEGTITVELDGYEISIKEDDLSFTVEKVGGARPKFKVEITTTNGDVLTGDETEKAITINITNITEFGENYIIEVKDKDENTISKEPNVITGITGQASYIINKSGTYTITVTGTKDGITKTATKTEEITVAMPQIEETVAFSRANGVIDIVWLNTDNTVRTESEGPLSPKDHLGGLTAIKYSDNNWVEANVENVGNDWYDYGVQTGTTDGKTSNWANARSSDGNAYFVWIPRYAYKITYFDTPTHANEYRENHNNKTGIIGYSNIEGIIDVVSGTEKLVTESAPTNVIGTVKTSGYTDYIPHPAFEFNGSKAGIWVGKYETKGSKSTGEVTIIPNATTLKSLEVGILFTACQSVKTKYDLTGDSHMMKNTEWGAVAYLAESKYRRTDTQSTTGNNYGIYDMNGGNWEFVTGVVADKLSNGSNYDFTDIDSKYYNTYTSYSESKKIKGDGVYETSTDGSSKSSWYGDFSLIVSTSSPVFTRGRCELFWCLCK